jgi:hypothetical protein
MEEPFDMNFTINSRFLLPERHRDLENELNRQAAQISLVPSDFISVESLLLEEGILANAVKIPEHGVICRNIKGIPKDSNILIYFGEIISTSEARKRQESYDVTVSS